VLLHASVVRISGMVCSVRCEDQHVSSSRACLSAGSFVQGSQHVWLIDLRNQMSTMLSERAAADDMAQRDQAAYLRQMEEQQLLEMQSAAAHAAALQAKKDKAAARRARGSIILEAHDLLGGGRRVEASISQRMRALGLSLADEAGITHGEVDAGSLVDLLNGR
jgi:hypothetical protein